MLRDVQPWPARVVCHPHRELGRSPHRITLLNFSGFPWIRGFPLPPGLHGVQTESLTARPRPSRAAESMPGHWANPTRSFVFSSVQPATTCEKLRHASHASLHQPCTRRAHPREREYATPGRHDARLTIGHLTLPIALSDRTGPGYHRGVASPRPARLHTSITKA